MDIVYFYYVFWFGHGWRADCGIYQPESAADMGVSIEYAGSDCGEGAKRNPCTNYIIGGVWKSGFLKTIILKNEIDDKIEYMLS